MRSLVELHGGNVTMKSDGVGRGTTVTIELPAPSEPRDVAPPSAEAPRFANRGATRARRRRLRLIALSGYSQTSDRKRAEGAGFDAHVAKPVSIEQLVALIE